jgi:hypothetical protein
MVTPWERCAVTEQSLWRSTATRGPLFGEARAPTTPLPAVLLGARVDSPADRTMRGEDRCGAVAVTRCGRAPPLSTTLSRPAAA